MTGTKFKHKHIDGLTCEITAETAKGYKVAQSHKGKTKVAFYHRIDFSTDKGLWGKLAPEFTVRKDSLGYNRYTIGELATQVCVCRVLGSWHCYRGTELLYDGNNVEEAKKIGLAGYRGPEAKPVITAAPTPTLF